MVARDRVCRQRRRLRKVFEADEEAFTLIVRELQFNGDGWRSVLPVIENNVSRLTLAFLLADYRSRPLRGRGGRQVSREYFKNRSVDEGCRYGNPYYEGSWTTPGAIESQLKAAERLARTDPEFAEWVDCYQAAFLEQRMCSAGWELPPSA